MTKPLEASSSRREFVARFGRFLLVGGSGVLIDFTAYFVLLHFGVQASIAKAISFILGSVWAYFANWKFTFGARRGKYSEFAFAAVYLSALAVNTATNSLALAVTAAFEWKYAAAFLAATGVSTIWNFVGMSLFVFRSAPTEEVDS